MSTTDSQLEQTEQISNTTDEPTDSGLACLAIISSSLGIPADYQHLKRMFSVSDEPVDSMTLLRAAKQLGLKAKKTKMKQRDWTDVPLPLIAILVDGAYVVIARAENEKLWIFDPRMEHQSVIDAEIFDTVWDGEVILFAKKANLSAISDKFNLRWFIPVVARFKKMFGEIIVMAFILQALGLITPFFSQVIIDKVLVHQGLTTLNILAIGLLAVAIFELILGTVKLYLFSHTTNRVDVILGAQLFGHLAALPLRYFETRRVGDIVARVRELETIRHFITGSALSVILDLFFGSVFIIVMFFYSVQLSLVVLGTLPFFVLLSLTVTPIFEQRLERQFACGAETQSFLVETITGINTVKSLAVEPQIIHKWENVLARFIKASFSTATLSNVAGNAAQFIQKVSSLAILWLGATLVMEGKLTIGQLIAFQMLSSKVIEPILRLFSTWQDFQQVKISVDRIGDILNYQPEPVFNPNSINAGQIEGHITLENVVFRYRSDGSPILDNISLDIKAGTTIGIVGRSGSGKSTLAKLVQRLYVPERGRIMVDNLDIVQIEPAWLRRQIGVVLQENFLFNGTVRDNIATAFPGAPMEKVIWAAKLAGAHEFIVELPEGYDTIVGERGTALSGGQRQRIAIARALITDPRILIFDEATSALDYQSEHIIQENLKQICVGRTVLIIAHRLSTVRDADQIIVMEKGQIVESGTHKELLRKNGIYKALHKQQEG